MGNQPMIDLCACDITLIQQRHHPSHGCSPIPAPLHRYHLTKITELAWDRAKARMRMQWPPVRFALHSCALSNVMGGFITPIFRWENWDSKSINWCQEVTTNKCCQPRLGPGLPMIPHPFSDPHGWFPTAASQLFVFLQAFLPISS